MEPTRPGNAEGFERSGSPIYTQPGEQQVKPRTEVQRYEEHEAVTTARVVGGGSMMEVVGGAAAAILSIIGLAGGLPYYMAAIATIAIGGALVSQGGAVTSRWSEIMHELDGGQYERLELGGGMSAEVMGGAAGIALGILALVGVLPNVLMAVAAVVFGGAVLMGGAAQPELSEMRLGPGASARARHVTREAVKASGATMALAGVGAIVLGILALIGTPANLTLILVSTLGLGGALLLGGTSLAAQVVRRLT